MSKQQTAELYHIADGGTIVAQCKRYTPALMAELAEVISKKPASKKAEALAKLALDEQAQKQDKTQLVSKFIESGLISAKDAGKFIEGTFIDTELTKSTYSFNIELFKICIDTSKALKYIPDGKDEPIEMAQEAEEQAIKWLESKVAHTFWQQQDITYINTMVSLFRTKLQLR